jgi:hypothetical protein
VTLRNTSSFIERKASRVFGLEVVPYYRGKGWAAR